MYKTIYPEPGKYSIIVPPGYYRFECWGAQGGTGCVNGEHVADGGPGAYTSGYIRIISTTTFYCFVGGKGGDGLSIANTKADSGYNGGGYGGADTWDNEGSGGGGGATDIRTIDGDWNNTESLESRIIVAAGGSGSAYHAIGAPGGDITGYWKTGNGIDNNKISNTTQTQGYSLGKGEDGRPFGYTPSSGAGGGYYGGFAANGRETGVYLAVSSSGSSYVSGYTGCKLNDKFIFKKAQIVNGYTNFQDPFGITSKGKIGNGAIVITRFINRATCDNHKSMLSYNLLVIIIFK